MDTEDTPDVVVEPAPRAAVFVVLQEERQIDGAWRVHGAVVEIAADLADTLILEGAARIATETDRRIARV